MRLKDNDLVVVTTGLFKGKFGLVEINPGYETIGINNGCVHMRVYPSEVRLASDSDRVTNP